MPISAVPEGTDLRIDTTARQKADTTGFRKVLEKTVTKADGEGIKPGNLIELGRISKETPTVSHILKNHPDYSSRCWDIILSSENQGKQFTKMSEGTLVALKPETNELVWGKELSLTTNEASEDKSINIGTINRDNPTVSHLFQANSGFDKNFWSIIHAPVNSNKEYRSLQPGTQVALNTETLELSFKNNASLKPTIETVKTIRPEQFAYREGPHHNSLADAVKPFTGKSYENIDCYGLVVRGLINQGIKYHGHGGLREKLEDLAELNSLPGKVNERVGEEFLKAEIKNWFTLAANRKESLKVTLGRVHKRQAQDFVMSGFPSLEKRG